MVWKRIRGEKLCTTAIRFIWNKDKIQSSNFEDLRDMKSHNIWPQWLIKDIPNYPMFSSIYSTDDQLQDWKYTIFPSQPKVWIQQCAVQSDKEITEFENPRLRPFLNRWTTGGRVLRNYRTPRATLTTFVSSFPVSMLIKHSSTTTFSTAHWTALDSLAFKKDIINFFWDQMKSLMIHCTEK